jgi:hypothetical protein
VEIYFNQISVCKNPASAFHFGQLAPKGKQFIGGHGPPYFALLFHFSSGQRLAATF